jgi:hypothetical protein
MKRLALATAISLSLAPSAFAGGMAEPVMEPEVVVEEAKSNSSGGWLVPLLLLVLIAAAVSSSSNNSPAP